MDRRMMIVAFAALLAVTAAAVVVGSASADSASAVYGSDVQPYAGMDVTYEELDDGATYYIVKGGSVSISFAGIEASGMETDLAGSGLITDYVTEKIYGTLEKSATVTIGEKTIRLDVSESATTLPVYGYTTETVNEGKFTDAYIQKSYSATYTFSNKWNDAATFGMPTDLTAYGLTVTAKKSGSSCTITITGTPTKGADSLEISITEGKSGVAGTQATRYCHVMTLTIKDTFTLVYDGNGGTPVKTGDTVKYGSSVILPSATRDDYHITGWYSQKSGGNDYGMPEDSFDPLAWGKSVNETIYLYAQWEMNKTPVISVDVDGASSIQVGQTTTLTATTSPDNADDGRVDWYPQSGTSYVKIIDTGTDKSGGTCTIQGLAAGTFVIRAMATDGSGKYKDWPITITEAPVETYTFTLIYNANGGSGAPSKFSTTTTGTTYVATVKTGTPTWSGHTFLGWSTNPSDTTIEFVGGDSITLKSDRTTTLYAIWETIKTTWTLTFDANGGSGAPGAMSASVAGTNYVWTLPSTVPTLSGYVFAGWARSESTTVAAYQAGGGYTSYVKDAVLYAVWEVEKTGYEFHLIFDVGEGSGGPGTTDMTDSVASKNIRIPETQPTRAGYEFLGWGINAGTSNVTWLPGETYTFSSGTTTLFAVWSQYTYVLTLYTTDESGASKKVEGVGVGEVSVTIPSDYIPTLSGYTFDGWQTKDKSTTYQPGQVLKISGDTSLYAKWIQTSEVKPSVRFNVTSDESQSTTVELVAGEDGSYRLPEYAPTRDGYRFLGWADVDNASAAVWHTGDILDMSTPKTLQVYAVWQIESTTWTLTFNATNGVGAPDAISMAATSATEKMEFTIPAAELTRDGYTFIGWDDQEDASTVLISPSGGTYVATSKSTTLYAVWKLGAPETYTVTFNDNGGTGGPGKKTSTGATFEIPDITPTRDGFVFVGWEWNHDGELKIIVPGKDATITLTDKETNLYAKWDAITADYVFDVIFNLDGGTSSNIVTKSTTSSTVPAKFTIPTDYKPTKADGSEFLGWSLTRNGEDRIQPGGEVELTSAETVLYAVWKSSSPTAPTLKWELSVKGSVLTFDGSASENVKSWVWDFGDGSKSSEKSGTHSYDAAGTYTVKLTVYSSSGMSSVCTKNVVVTEGSDPVAEKGILFYLVIALVIVMVAVIGARLAGVF